MKVSEAIAQGYRLKEVKFQRGYTSRKTELDDREVLEAQGRRKGQKYFLYPCPWSTRYCYRMYIEKP